MDFPVSGRHKHTPSVMENVNAFQLHLPGGCKFLKDLIDVVGVCNASQKNPNGTR